MDRREFLRLFAAAPVIAAAPALVLEGPKAMAVPRDPGKSVVDAYLFGQFMACKVWHTHSEEFGFTTEATLRGLGREIEVVATAEGWQDFGHRAHTPVAVTWDDEFRIDGVACQVARVEYPPTEWLVGLGGDRYPARRRF